MLNNEIETGAFN